MNNQTSIVRTWLIRLLDKKTESPHPRAAETAALRTAAVSAASLSSNWISIVRTWGRRETFGLPSSKTLLVFGAALSVWCGSALDARGQLPLAKPATAASGQAT